MNILTPYLRERSIHPERAQFLYSLYLLLRGAPASISADSKQRSFEAAAAGDHHWEVVAISENALRVLYTRMDRKAVRRGHAFSRNQRFLHLFGPGSKLLSQDAMMQFYFEHDASALLTVGENSIDGFDHWSKLHAVPENFFVASGYGVSYRRRVEHLWVRDQIRQIDALHVSGHSQSPLTSMTL